MYGEKNPGSNDGVYGEIGVPDPSNIPKERHSATASYDKSSDTLWLFGGRNHISNGNFQFTIISSYSLL
jgi:hypothetical protein